MHTNVSRATHTKPTHDWLQKVSVTLVPAEQTPLLERFTENLLQCFQEFGHSVQDEPDRHTDVILTTAIFGEPVGWRDALLFTARRRYSLDHSPTVFTIVHITPGEFRSALEHFAGALQKDPLDSQDFAFPGLAPDAYQTLSEQGQRGGPILSLVRLVQTQSMSIRVILVVGEDDPQSAYTFDLVGAYPRTDSEDVQFFYEDLMLRIVTAVSTREVTKHQVVGEPIPHEVWKQLDTPDAMFKAGKELGLRNFFTEMVRVADLAHVPALQKAISSQYSEGCYATWDPRISALIATITGSARPVDKDNLTDDELAVLVGVRPDGEGALIRHVEGKRNDPPSSEAVELIEMDSPLPRIRLGEQWPTQAEAPVARSKLHGHRSVRAYDPNFVEHVYLDKPYYHYPVSCSTEAQAKAIKAAFAKSDALSNPADPRQVVFTILPGHGIVIVEKWVHGKEPFQLIWEYMDEGKLDIENRVPQGPLTFERDQQGKMFLALMD